MENLIVRYYQQEIKKLVDKSSEILEEEQYMYLLEYFFGELSNRLEKLVMPKIAELTPGKFLDELDQYNEDMPYHTIGDYGVGELWTEDQVMWMLDKYYELKSNFTA